METGYQVYELGAMDSWERHIGGRVPVPGRKFLEGELALASFGVSVNERKPGEEAGYWHDHHVVEELYLFLEGEGELALGTELLQVHAGTAVRVGPGVPRTWRCRPDSPIPLRWICVRGGGAPLAEIGMDSERPDLPMPWRA
jgi:mannose-6-phosphate isomerase-like protein (cupin superfamily)